MTRPSYQASQRPAWERAAYAAVLSADQAEAALAAMEGDRLRYAEVHRLAADRIVRLAPELGRPDLGLRGRLVLADIALRRGAVVAVARLVKDILRDAEQMGDAFIIARTHFLLCDVQHALGDSPSARISGIRSLELLPEDTPLGIRVDHLRSLGTAYGPGPDSRRCHIQALDLVAVIGDATRTIGIHNSLSYFAFELGDMATAIEHSDRMVELSRVRGIPLLASQLDTVARVLMMRGRPEAAIDVLRELIPRAGDPTRLGGIEDLDPKPYGLPECLLTLAEAHRTLGRFVTAQHALASAHALAQERGLGRFRARVLEAQALLAADLGDFRTAYRMHMSFHAAVAHLHSDEQEARARSVQASYDAGEERRDVERFRELALRDALTGLYNRRFIDDEIASLLRNAATQHTPVSAAIVDADFFKRINDELSHDVGDHVLRAVAAILATSVTEPSIVGRLGGEEFLVLMPGVPACAALERCEAIRRAIHDHDWTPLTGTIPVTVSIGLSTVGDAPTSAAALLSDADRNLYAAKRSGRNRVMAAAR